MKKIINGAFFLLLVAVCYAQQKEGKVVYQYKLEFKPGAVLNSSMGIVGNAGIPSASGMRDVPEIPLQQFELLFGNNSMLWKQLDNERPEPGQQGGMVMAIDGGGGGQSAILFCDLENGKKVRQQYFMDKQFLIEDSITKLNWIMSSETKVYLNHLCRKATASRIEKQMRPMMKDGKFENEEVADTAHLVAWFAADIPVPAGPEVQGQLPGLIMELEISKINNKQVYRATSLSAKVDVSDIKAPVKGKKVTEEVFKKEMNKIMKDMQRRGGRNTIQGNG